MRIPIINKTTKNAFCQEKNGLPGILLVSTILALRNETIWSGFLWYLTVPSIQGFVHKPSTLSPPKKVKATSTNLENAPVQYCLPYLNNSKAIKYQICKIENLRIWNHVGNVKYLEDVVVHVWEQLINIQVVCMEPLKNNAKL